MLPLVLQSGRYGLVLVQVKGRGVNFMEGGNDGKIYEAMKNCTLYGVFGMTSSDKRLSLKEKEKRLVLQRAYDSFPVVRILVNLSTFGGNPQNGSRVLTDDDSPFLVIQSDGTLFNDWREKDNWKEKTMSNFFSSAVSIAGDAVEGKIPCYEAQRRDPPISLTPHVPFNPVYLGVRHDNDRIFVEKDKDKDILARRPKFENIPPGE